MHTKKFQFRWQEAKQLTALLWIVIAFVSGALPLSVWLGRLVLRVDIRQYGDGNPGAANVWRAGGSRWGMLAILLDFFKGALPVGLANFGFELAGWALVAVALAPVMGHAFSPFLRFQGGKSLAVTFGIWAGLSLWQVPVILGLFFALYLVLFSIEGWAVMAGSFSLLIVFLISGAPWEWLAVWLGTTLIFGWKHRADFRQKPQMRRRRQA